MCNVILKKHTYTNGKMGTQGKNLFLNLHSSFSQRQPLAVDYLSKITHENMAIDI